MAETLARVKSALQTEIDMCGKGAAALLEYTKEVSEERVEETRGDMAGVLLKAEREQISLYQENDKRLKKEMEDWKMKSQQQTLAIHRANKRIDELTIAKSVQIKLRKALVKQISQRKEAINKFKRYGKKAATRMVTIGIGESC